MSGVAACRSKGVPPPAGRGVEGRELPSLRIPGAEAPSLSVWSGHTLTWLELTSLLDSAPIMAVAPALRLRQHTIRG